MSGGAVALGAVLVLLLAVPGRAQLAVGEVDGRRGLCFGDQPLLALDTPWVASGGWQSVWRAPESGDFERRATAAGERLTRLHTAPGGRVVESVECSPLQIKLRYDFAFGELPGAEHLQWVLRCEPSRFDAALVSGQTTRSHEPQPVAGVQWPDLQQLLWLLPSCDLQVQVACSAGTWQFSDQRQAAWAKCYRLEWNRPLSIDGRRDGWVELTFTARDAAGALVPLTTGEQRLVGGLPLVLGEPLGRLSAPVQGLLLYHTANGPLPPGGAAGQVTLTLADGSQQSVALRCDRELADPTDDPRTVPQGVLRPLPDGTPAWVTAWPLPVAAQPVRRLTTQSSAAGWRLLAASGIGALASPARVAALLAAGRAGSLPQETIVPLDGTWQVTLPDGTSRDLPVPARWDSDRALRPLHELTYRRTFDLPASLGGQRLALRCDAVGEIAEVWVNERFAGSQIAGPLPVEFDLTGLVEVPSSGNHLEVRVRDDTHCSIPAPARDWRPALQHWVPHGIGGNNRKGLFQTVTLRARPAVHVADAQIVSSVRQHRLTVTYELFNGSRETVAAVLQPTVRPAAGGAVELTLPETRIELPGQVITTVTVTAPWASPRLWQPDHPDLYQLRTVLTSAAGTRLDRRLDRFGFREVWFEGIHFYLNGVRCNLRGESPSYAQSEGPLETREGAAAWVRRALDANFNVLRFHAAPAPPHVLDVCDELGMLVIDESGIYASWGHVAPTHPNWLPACRDHLTRLVRRDRLHPSVVLWSAENEGLNVNQLSPAQLADFAATIRAADATRPVIFDGDGSGYGASPASVKHYVRTIEDLQERGGRSSGYGRDMRHDIYWAADYRQDLPLGCGEFLFPETADMKARKPELIALMGLQTRGYRYADWFDIRPYNPFYSGYQGSAGVPAELAVAWDILVKSFAAVAVFDQEYDALGPFPDPPALPIGQAASRTLLVYNDTFATDTVTLEWSLRRGEQRLAGETRDLT
ncbi:MAG: hypothetical protein IT204_24315, partial [Fimbriimonadaceae bacterium]|nr:hypothetical protein [Fimbriimonadaceae bacterium]